MRRRPGVHCFLALSVAAAFLPAAAQAPVANGQPAVTVAPGVTYQNIRSTTPAGGPWSIHVLRVSQSEKGLRVAAVAGATAEGYMTRVLPTEIARSAANNTEQIVAVVNGDYDLSAPYLGAPDGLSITSRRLWTTGKPTWPAMALAGSSARPVIAIPEVEIEMRAGKRRWSIGGLNKMLGSGHGSHPRAYTYEYGATMKQRSNFRAVVIRRISPSLPLRANRSVTGVVSSVVEDVAELDIPRDAIVVAERTIDETFGPSIGEQFKAGMKVRLDFRVRVGGQRDIREAIGGYPVLVRDGRRSIEGDPSSYISQRHPRTAVCYNARELIFVVVDGRQPFLSYGMTLEELADLMVSLGCTVAMNTDGGGSSVMAVTSPAPAAPEGQSLGANTPADKNDSSGASAPISSGLSNSALRIVNSPSDGSERGRGNAWVILKRK